MSHGFPHVSPSWYYGIVLAEKAFSEKMLLILDYTYIQLCDASLQCRYVDFWRTCIIPFNSSISFESPLLPLAPAE